MKSKWLLVDGDYLIAYLWFRGPEVAQQFWLELTGYINEFRTRRIAIAWDSRKDRRRALNPHYKRNRVVPDEWREAKPKLKEDIINSLTVLPVAHGTVEGLEADDLIWCWQKKRQGFIISGDRDLWQCLDRDEISVWSPRQKFHTTIEGVVKEFGGVFPMVVQKCMIGDKSDGIRGIEGVGPKRAKELWEKYSQTLVQLVTADTNSPLIEDDPWLHKVYQDKQTVQLNWKILKIGELITQEDLEKAERLVTNPIKLFNADAARFYVAQKGWFSVLKEWPHVIKAFQQVLI